MRSHFTIGDRDYRVFAQREGNGHRVHVDDKQYKVTPYVMSAEGALVIDGTLQLYVLVQDGDTLHVWMEGLTETLRYHDPVEYYGSHGDSSADDIVQAPMPGTVIAVHAAAGQQVARGDTLLVIESMKLETAVKAPRDGVVAAVHVAVGQSFDRSAALATLAAAEA